MRGLALFLRRLEVVDLCRRAGLAVRVAMAVRALPLGLAEHGFEDPVRVDLLVDETVLAERYRSTDYETPETQTWWQQIYRENVTDLDRGGIFEDMTTYRKIADKPTRRIE